MTESSTDRKPDAGSKTDPREFAWIPVGNLRIDDRIQRHVSPDKVAKIHAKFNWEKFEALTVVPTDTVDIFTVIEGQHRSGAALLYGGAELLVPCMVLSSAAANDDIRQAEVALGIVSGRSAHSRLEQWNLAVNSGEVRHVLATTELDKRGLRVGMGLSAVTIASVAAIESMLRTGSVDDGVGLLCSTLDSLIDAYPATDLESSAARWERSVLLAVAAVHRRHPELNNARLTKVLRVKPATQWTSVGRFGPGEGAAHTKIALRLVEDYNRNLRSNRLAP